jgi:hypothetical protein
VATVGDEEVERVACYVVPDAFAHGTSEQHESWFLKGSRTGDLKQGGINLERVRPYRAAALDRSSSSCAGNEVITEGMF